MTSITQTDQVPSVMDLGNPAGIEKAPAEKVVNDLLWHDETVVYLCENSVAQATDGTVRTRDDRTVSRGDLGPLALALNPRSSHTLRTSLEENGDTRHRARFP